MRAHTVSTVHTEPIFLVDECVFSVFFFVSSLPVPLCTFSIRTLPYWEWSELFGKLCFEKRRGIEIEIEAKRSGNSLA